MSEVTGPISTLPGFHHDLPDGTMCDQHPDRPAVARVQGETDSFGAELIDMCAECLGEDREYANSAEARTGKCDWCEREATDLRARRDYEEGMYGRVYRVCGACVARHNAELESQDSALDEDWDDGRCDYDDPYDYDDPPFEPGTASAASFACPHCKKKFFHEHSLQQHARDKHKVRL